MLILGIGGVGSWVCEGLARSGVEHLTLVDLDDICISNTNRQLHALSDTYGRPKVEVMSERIRNINANAKVLPVHDFVTAKNLEQIIDGQFDLVIDAIDSLFNKVAVLKHCRAQKIPVITIGGAGGKRDPTQIVTADLSQTSNDGLLRMVRKTLRRKHDFSTTKLFDIPAIYSRERTYLLQDDGTFGQKTAREAGEALSCDTGLGTACFVTGAFGFAACAVAVNMLISAQARP